MPKAMKIPNAKAAVDKEWVKLKIKQGQNQKLRANKRRSMRHRKNVKQFMFQRSWTFAI